MKTLVVAEDTEICTLSHLSLATNVLETSEIGHKEAILTGDSGENRLEDVKVFVILNNKCCWLICLCGPNGLLCFFEQSRRFFLKIGVDLFPPLLHYMWSNAPIAVIVPNRKS